MHRRVQSSKIMIKINNLNKNYGSVNILNHISLHIEEGKICGLVGKSGVGKSTLLRCLNGLETYNSGSIQIDNVEISTMNKKELNIVRKSMGMIFQHFSLIDRKTVYDNVALPLRCWFYPKDKIRTRVEELLKLVGLEEKAGDKARNLSGGQKQRAAIARALALNPKILLCDEATSALDPKTTNDVLRLIKKINETLHITIVFVTHQMSVVKQICDDVVLLEEGRILEKGPVEEVFLRQSEALERLIGAEDELPVCGGCNYKIIIPTNCGTEFLSRMAMDLESPYSILSGSIEQFKDNRYNTFVINISEAMEQQFLDYFNKNRIVFKKINVSERSYK